MHVKYAFVCDGANIAQNGNLNALGIFTHINAKEFPYVHPKMCFVLAIECRRSEAGTHLLKAIFIDEDGRDIIPPLNGPIEINPEMPSANFMFDLLGVSFPKPGVYSIDIVMDSQLLRTETITVQQMA